MEELKTEKQPDIANRGLKPETTPIQQKSKEKRAFFLYFLIAGIILLLAILGIQALLAYRGSDYNRDGRNMLQPKKIGFFQTVKNFLFPTENILTGQTNDRINILLLGIGGPGHDGPYLSDTNIIVSIKPSTQEVAMISVPRDLGVKMENYGVYRVNYADALGESKNPGQGGEYARQIFSQAFNIDIPYYVRVDFSAFEQIIDAVGGVEVEVTKPFTDYSFPGPNYSYQTISFASGTQTMNGETALKYARSRHGTNGENSDFSRSRRQQQILSAMKERIFSLGTFTNPIVIQKIWTSVSNNIATNLNLNQIIYLAGVAKDIDTSKIKTLVLDSGPNGYLYAYLAPSGAFMLAPKNNDYGPINSAIANIFNSDYKQQIPTSTANQYAYQINSSSTVSTKTPSATVPLDLLSSAKVEIQNGTWRAGLASRYQTKLSDSGYTIITIGNSLRRPISSTVIYLINPSVSNDIVNSLTKQISGKIEMTLPEWLHEDYDDPNTLDNEMGAKFNPETDILVLLGTDANE